MLCLVTSPNLFDTFGHISLFRCQEYWWSTGLRTLCAHPQRTNTIKTRQCAPLPIPRVQAVPASVTGERRAKQLLPVYPASATTVISWNKARMQPHGSTGCSVTLQPLSLSLSLFLSTFSSSVNWWHGYFSNIFNLSSAIALHGIFMLAHFTVYNVFHPHFTHLSCKAVVHPVGHQGHCLGSSNWMIRGVWVTAVPKTDVSDKQTVATNLAMPAIINYSGLAAPINRRMH